MLIKRPFSFTSILINLREYCQHQHHNVKCKSSSKASVAAVLLSWDQRSTHKCLTLRLAQTNPPLPSSSLSWISWWFWIRTLVMMTVMIKWEWWHSQQSGLSSGQWQLWCRRLFTPLWLDSTPTEAIHTFKLVIIILWIPWAEVVGGVSKSPL